MREETVPALYFHSSLFIALNIISSNSIYRMQQSFIFKKVKPVCHFCCIKDLNDDSKLFPLIINISINGNESQI